MTEAAGAPIRLFSYGTLRQENVQMETFGRLLKGETDALPGYALSMVEITDPDVIATSGAAFHPIVRASGDAADAVAGTVFEITAAELAAADSYEVSDYKRVAVRLTSGRDAFVYVKA
ncbi:UDP-N-acetylmuramate--alanine ligase [Caulobacter sp. Root1455]|uniref:gamma-glutamylcyclotransferase family protein n=1 Tax=unclassified Caulobacter TaxID=2648921 RepID=UPI0006F95F52|nr:MULTISPECIES: gamma-glutamylcyclotransferase family protein [unclassified Caulobacter]KQY27305.1 UDP-N-acetylmuramate--alanine ligase [Caulobacter sp. Root487D2Y]KQY92634.1 UDP-N-acetylmuramate--alanine ligase [Caulobacter sp. Root1455]